MPPPDTPSRPEHHNLVKVDTALTVLSQINLLKESNALALDIGGSLAKLVYLQPHLPHNRAPPPLKIHQVDGTLANALSVPVPVLDGTLHFFAFESRNIHQLLRFIRRNWAHHTARRHIRATGGGSFKYESAFRDEIDVSLATLDEMTCTVAGLNFLLTYVDNEVYIYSKTQPHRPPQPASVPHATQLFVPAATNPFPYLLVNIGSGVSIVKVTDHATFERVSGSSLGGGTFWGLARMLLDCQTFDQVIDLTNHGDNRNVDMLVGDIYGGAYENLGLDASVIAASFGKATMRNDYARHQLTTFSLIKDRFRRAICGTLDLWLSFCHALPLVGRVLKAFGIGSDVPWSPTLITHTGAQYRPQDIALALLRMVSYNIGQIAYLNARVHNLDRIYFGGNFIRNHPYTVADISFAVDFWSQGKMKALFLKHDGYLGAIGAFIGASSASPRKIIDETSKSVEEPSHKTSNHYHKSAVSTAQSKPTCPNAHDNPGGRSETSSPQSSENGSEDASGTENANGHLASEERHSKPSNPTSVPNADRSHSPPKQNAFQANGESNRPPGGKSSRRRRRKPSKGQPEIPTLLPDSKSSNPGSVGSEDLDSGGDWTTVTRVRRRAPTKDVQ
ncbi:Pantothenate kinase 2 [Gracilariopsis chorda]|uniref:Pantothenate kinase 2 n=1 Tax=Gracilariopsis chorda TaxID=448386 RepID=A0A2V3IJB8_9FLOR|nr:Pantothenate kinase 2 [Gracilariopsis chorda]|eukprot:PXF41220.1 Pantothenate kinase 2 [Gracilariopsis chorda]